jgi:hypothetical protein
VAEALLRELYVTEALAALRRRIIPADTGYQHFPFGDPIMRTPLLSTLPRWLRLAPLPTVVNILIPPPFDPQERAENTTEA